MTGSTLTCAGPEKAKSMVHRTYEAAVELFAVLCKEYGLNPLTDICSRKETPISGINGPA